MFQSPHYCGGFDADDLLFNFSFYADDGAEYWFSFSLGQVAEILSGKLKSIDSIRQPSK